jgi:hypothetical protein
MVLVFHGLVFLSLAAMHLLGMTVAAQSIGAMLFRTVLWTGITIMIRPKAAQGT